MPDQPSEARRAPPPSPMAAFAPPGVLMWASMYAAMFYVCGGIIAYLYQPD